jgi:hypothetical protein
VTGDRPRGAASSAALWIEALAVLAAAISALPERRSPFGISLVISAMERPSEIGLRRALGATKGHIRLQCFSEAILLAVLGGAAGKSRRAAAQVRCKTLASAGGACLRHQARISARGGAGQVRGGHDHGHDKDVRVEGPVLNHHLVDPFASAVVTPCRGGAQRKPSVLQDLSPPMAGGFVYQEVHRPRKAVQLRQQGIPPAPFRGIPPWSPRRGRGTMVVASAAAVITAGARGRTVSAAKGRRRK